MLWITTPLSKRPDNVISGDFQTLRFTELIDAFLFSFDDEPIPRPVPPTEDGF